MSRWQSSSLVLFLVLLFANGCNKEVKLFEKLDLERAGISFLNTIASAPDLNIIDFVYFYNGGGVSIGDVNNDGLPDIFFSANQGKNKLYLNKGNLTFEDITDRAGVAGENTWDTGSVMGDVNGDGYLDIYVCAVVGLKNLRGHNELFINNGDDTFSERSEEYGLDFEAFSSSASFLDFDLDGDLDMFLLNHAVHTPESFGHANLRNTRTEETGGKLLKNEGGKFVDVSSEANIYGGINGYGLGVGVADFNLDGYPDIYVGNDFHEDDYLYINNGNGTFTESGKSAFTSTSKFSMGNDITDINHDGLPDLISLDMLPADEATLKKSVDEESVDILKIRTRQYGYNYQYPRNAMQINLGNGQFAETALISGVAATDWSWSALFADFDQDANQDLFVSNGIPHRPNDLDYIKYVSSEQVVNVIGNTKLADEKALALMPEGNAQNFVFRGSGGYRFEDKSALWLPREKTCSTAAAWGDLDNDGDLDIVTNNVNAAPSFYINQSVKSAHYLKIKLKDENRNQFGIGAKLYSYHKGIVQYKEMFTVRGFQSSSEPVVHFGYGAHSNIDSIRVIWPDGNSQLLKNVSANQTLTLSHPKASAFKSKKLVKKEQIFFQVNPADIGITYQHEEDNYTDFHRLKLLPYQQSDRGPAIALGDIDNDGKVDVYFGGSKHIPGQFFRQANKTFNRAFIPEILRDSLNEDVEAIMEDFDKNGKTDLLIATGGADFYGKSAPLLDTYYLSKDDGFLAVPISGFYENASCLRKGDFDGDGYVDLFIGNESVSNDFGAMPRSMLLHNESGKLVPMQDDLFASLGMVTDATWDDFDQDGQLDLIVVGEWMEPIFLKNQSGKFTRVKRLGEKLNGLWQSISAFDIDQDGDRDLVLGNWGLNSKFRATERNPMLMYYGDIDGNDITETIIAIEKNGKYYPLEGYDNLIAQIPLLQKKFPAYRDMAGRTMEELFTQSELSKMKVYEVNQLASGYLKSEQKGYTFVSFADELQLAPIMAQCLGDFDGDARDELLIAGNYFGVPPLQGRFGSFGGALIKNERNILLGIEIGLNLINQSVRHIDTIDIGTQRYLLITINNGKPQVYRMSREL
jgi:enediyne biosynthesis protein E4